MKKLTADPLDIYPPFRTLRDAILIRDPDAKKAGEDFLNRVLLLSLMTSRLPADRLVTTADAARMLGVEVSEFDYMAYQAQIKPCYVLTSATYWRAGDVYSLLEA